MTKLLITYDTVGADGIRGEACCEVEVSDTVANALLTLEHIDPQQKWMYLLVDDMLINLEMLRDRHYVMDSIKDIRPAEKI